MSGGGRERRGGSDSGHGGGSSGHGGGREDEGMAVEEMMVDMMVVVAVELSPC